jgi:hypothetical protein
MELTKAEVGFIAKLRKKGFIICAWEPAEIHEIRPSWSPHQVIEEVSRIAIDVARRIQRTGLEALDAMLTKG